ncbi:hypothetical protein Agabi119p4_11719 [Agaricus bisporus var. burnettii]|uniref:Cytochrome P450 n=1 Tax=Agaricus bisporus var. burnettii TaxID=192524 RepID=A0A8H7C1S7_AGABI|nr:hypothetical protein Agabi119p4_11719 [Agaricus bisporus var. burnettii]
MIYGYVRGPLLDAHSPESKEEETVRRSICANGFIGGADTTVSSVTSFFMAMAIYPDVQKKAQAELDRVLGSRLPEINDRSSLPYTSALFQGILMRMNTMVIISRKVLMCWGMHGK